MPGIDPIRTKRLLIREFQLGDRAALLAIVRDPDQIRHMLLFLDTEGQLDDFLSMAMASALVQPRLQWHFAVEDAHVRGVKRFERTPPCKRGVDYNSRSAGLEGGRPMGSDWSAGEEKALRGVSRVGSGVRRQARDSGVEVVARDRDLVCVVGFDGVLHAKHGRPLAQICDVGAGQPMGCTGQLGGEPVGRLGEATTELEREIAG